GQTGLVAVAEIGVGAGRAVRGGGGHALVGGLVAHVDGAGVAVVAEVRLADADAGLAAVVDLAEETVVARGAIRQRRADAGARGAAVAGRAELEVVAGGAVGEGRVLAATGGRVAGVGGAGVAVIACEIVGADRGERGDRRRVQRAGASRTDLLRDAAAE